MMFRFLAAFILLTLAGAAPIWAQIEEVRPPTLDIPDLLFFHGNWPQVGGSEQHSAFAPGERVREAERIKRFFGSAKPPPAGPHVNSALAHRSGSMLTIWLRYSAPLSFVDSTGGCEQSYSQSCISHVFVEWMPPNWYVIEAREKSYLHYGYLVSYNSGKVWRFDAPPIISRDRRFAVALNPGVMHGPFVSIAQFEGDWLTVEHASVSTECVNRPAGAARLKLEPGRQPVRTAADRIDFLRVGVDTPDAGPGSVHLLRREGKWRMICDR